MRASYLLILSFGIILGISTFLLGRSTLLLASLLLIAISAFFAAKDLLTTGENRFVKGVLYFLFHFFLLIWFLSSSGVFSKTVGEFSFISAFILVIVSNTISRKIKGKRILDF